MCEVPSQELNDALVESLQDQLKPDKERRQKALDHELLLKAKGFLIWIVLSESLFLFSYQQTSG